MSTPRTITSWWHDDDRGDHTAGGGPIFLHAVRVCERQSIVLDAPLDARLLAGIVVRVGELVRVRDRRAAVAGEDRVALRLAHPHDTPRSHDTLLGTPARTLTCDKLAAC
jgi:hypothetical protein